MRKNEARKAGLHRRGGAAEAERRQLLGAVAAAAAGVLVVRDLCLGLVEGLAEGRHRRGDGGGGDCSLSATFSVGSRLLGEGKTRLHLALRLLTVTASSSSSLFCLSLLSSGRLRRGSLRRGLLLLQRLLLWRGLGDDGGDDLLNNDGDGAVGLYHFAHNRRLLHGRGGGGCGGGLLLGACRFVSCDGLPGSAGLFGRRGFDVGVGGLDNGGLLL